MQHTPGPWTANGSWVVAADGPIVETVAYARVRSGEAEANARLIAAAPDLLVLAEEVAKEYEDAADWKDAIGRLQRLARAAVAKAKGE